MANYPIPFEKIDECYYYMCCIQARLFKLAQNMDFDDDNFVKKYMNSNICNKAIDSLYSPLQMAEPEDIMDYFLEKENPKKNTQHYDTNAVKWTGFMYRYLQLRLGIPSSVIHKYRPLSHMLVYYTGMHTQDDEYVVDVIKEQLQKEGLL